MIFAGGGFKWGKGRDALTALAETLEGQWSLRLGSADEKAMAIRGLRVRLAHVVTG